MLSLNIAAHSALLPAQVARRRRRHVQGNVSCPILCRAAPRSRCRLSYCRQRGHPRCLRPHQRAQSEQSAALFSLALARASAGAGRRHPRIRSRLQSDRAAGDAALFGARHPWRDLQGAAGRERGVPSSCALDHAVRDFRHAALAGLSPGRRDGPLGAVLGQPRRVRRYQPPGGEAGGGRFARARARQSFGRADAPPRRDGRRRLPYASSCSARSIRRRTPSISSPRTCWGMCRR